MIVPDVNLLLYAHITAFPQHADARRWWEACLSDVRGPAVGLPLPVVFAFVRIATNPRVIRPPMSLDAATATVDSWLARPHVRVLAPGPDHVSRVWGLLRAAGAAKDLTTDAQIAALAQEHQATVLTHDVDFLRFSGLRVSRPLG